MYTYITLFINKNTYKITKNCQLTKFLLTTSPPENVKVYKIVICCVICLLLQVFDIMTNQYSKLVQE